MSRTSAWLPVVFSFLTLAFFLIGCQPSVPALIEKLGGQDAAARDQAKKDLQARGAEAVDPLIKALGNPNAAVAENAGDVLVKMGATALPSLQKTLAGADEAAAVSVVGVLAKTGDKGAKDAIVKLAIEDAGKKGDSARKAVAAGGKPMLTDLLGQFSGIKDPAQKKRMVELIVGFKDRAAVPVLEKALAERTADLFDPLRVAINTLMNAEPISANGYSIKVKATSDEHPAMAKVKPAANTKWLAVTFQINNWKEKGQIKLAADTITLLNQNKDKINAEGHVAGEAYKKGAIDLTLDNAAGNSVEAVLVFSIPSDAKAAQFQFGAFDLKPAAVLQGAAAFAMPPRPAQPAAAQPAVAQPPPAGKAPAGKAPAFKAPAGKAPAGKSPAGKAPRGKAPH